MSREKLPLLLCSASRVSYGLSFPVAEEPLSLSYCTMPSPQSDSMAVNTPFLFRGPIQSRYAVGVFEDM